MKYIIILFLYYGDGTTQEMESKDIYSLPACQKQIQVFFADIESKFPGTLVKGGCKPVDAV